MAFFNASQFYTHGSCRGKYIDVFWDVIQGLALVKLPPQSRDFQLTMTTFCAVVCVHYFVVSH